MGKIEREKDGENDRRKREGGREGGRKEAHLFTSLLFITLHSSGFSAYINVNNLQ